MYAKLNNGSVEIYPYSIGQLRKDNPSTSFPKEISTEVLETFNVVEVIPSNAPEITYNQKVSEVTPTLENGVWKQTFSVSDLTQEELSAKTNQKSSVVREKRDGLLADTDWTQVADAPVDKTVWATYRQALRDIPLQAGFPWNVTWPVKP